LDKQPPWARGFVMVLQSALSDLNRFQLHNRKTPRLSMQAGDFLPENAPARRVGFVFCAAPCPVETGEARRDNDTPAGAVHHNR
jgi:hypothetical protein